MQILIPELTAKHVLAIRVMDADFVGQDDTVGEFDVPLDKTIITKESEFLRSAEEIPITFNLKPKSGTQARQAGAAAGELNVLMQYTPFFNADADDGDDGDDPGKALEKLAVRLCSTQKCCLVCFAGSGCRARRSRRSRCGSACLVCFVGSRCRPRRSTSSRCASACLVCFFASGCRALRPFWLFRVFLRRLRPGHGARDARGAAMLASCASVALFAGRRSVWIASWVSSVAAPRARPSRSSRCASV